MFKEVNRDILLQAKRQNVFKKPICCGLDIHKIPWFGKKKDKYVLGAERFQGTSFGHGYASIECVENGKRFTLAALPLHQFITKEDIITSLLKESRKHVDIECLFLDRGFFNVESISTLLNLSIPFVIPAIRNKKVKGIVKEFKESCKKFAYKEHYSLIREYTMKKAKESVKFTLVVIVEAPKKSGEQWNDFVYATNINVTNDNAFEIAESYRKRWGIETGYRVKENVRGKTCSRNYVIRLFLQLLSIILYNLWQICNIIISVKIKWEKRTYPVILEEFKDIISDLIVR